MKRISFFYIFSVLGIIGLLFASVSHAAFLQFDENDPNYQLALSIAAAQEAQKEVDINEKIILDEDFTPEDFGLTSVGILPTSPFYFLKGIRRTVQSAFTFDPVGEAELKIRFSAEKLLETNAVASQEGASPDDIKYALENFQGELARVNARVQDAADGLGEEKAVELTKKLMDSMVKYQKSLGKIEKTLPSDLFGNIKLAKEKTSETFGGAFDLVEPEKAAQELTTVLEDQKGSEFKDFKNIEVLKEIEEKVPEKAKDAMRLAQGQALTRLQGELEKLQFAKRAVFEDFVREIGGSGVQHLEIITDLEAQPLSADVREVLASVKEEALSKTDKRLQTLTQPQQEKFLEHLALGEIKNVRVLKELEQNVSKGVLQGILQAKGRAKGSIVEKVKESEFQEKGKQELFRELEQSHDAGSLAVLEEIEALIPSDKKAFFSELKQKAVVEIKRDIDRAGTASQRQVIFAALAGDHPEQLGVINRFQKEVDVPFDFGSIWEGMRRAQAERFEMRAESIKDRERLGRLEEEFGKQKEEFKEFRRFDDLFRTRRSVFDSPERAQAQIRQAEERIAELDKIIDSLPFDASFEGGKFDPFLTEIERLLEVAEQKLKAAHDVISQQPGRAFGFANAAADIARHGIRMAEEYKSGRKEVRCPFFFPPPPNFCQNGKVVSDIDQNGCQLPPRCEFVERCPFPPPIPFNFCSNGRIVYEKSSQGCPLPPRCEEFRTCSLLIVDPKPCPEGSYRDGFYKDGCFVYGECRVAEKQYFSCGGIAGLHCPNGYRCEMPTPTYPDAMGKCIPTEEKPIICQAYWSGFVWRSETNSCVKEGASGCSDPYVFHTQEECEKANKITICPAMPTVDSCPAGQRKVVTFSSPQCGTYYGCESGEPTGKPQCFDGVDNDNDGLIDYPKDTGCYGADDTTETPYVGGSCLSYTAQTSCQTSGCVWYANHHDGTHCDDAAHGQGGGGGKDSWIEHIWKFSDGVTEKSFIFNRMDAEYLDYIKKIEAQCLAIPKSKFAWKSQAGNSDPANWQNFGIPDCSGTAVNYVCGNKICDPGETMGSCPADCGTITFTCNNNKVCEGNENYTSCPGDCGGTTYKPQCSDGIDNDNDGKIDYPADTSCYDGTDNDEWYPSSTTTTKCTAFTEATCNTDVACKWVSGFGCGSKAQCNDGIDNDNDGLIDYPKDSGCVDNFDDSEGVTATGGCLSRTTEATCKSAACTWYIGHHDGTHCDDAAHGGGTAMGVPSPGPSGLTFASGGTSVVFNWTDNSFEESNKLEERIMGGTTWNVMTSVGGVAGTGSIPYPNRSSGSYEYRVVACNTSGCSTPSNIVTVTYGGTTTPPPPTTKPQCSDGIDNDNDGRIDYPADTGCYGADDNDEAMTGTATCGVPEACYDAVYCADGKDNDADGFIDGADPGCGITTVSCGDKVCSSSESATSCPGDCGGTSTNTCSSTPSACITQSACTGAAYFWCNGACYGTQASCPTSSTYCNFNNVCDAGETTSSCPSDCKSTTSNFCGDHVCGGSETSVTCPMDCGATSPTPPPSTTTTCPSGQYWYVPSGSTSGYCKSTSTTDCPSGQIWDSATNMCKSSTTGASLLMPFLKLFGF